MSQFAKLPTRNGNTCLANKKDDKNSQFEIRIKFIRRHTTTDMMMLTYRYGTCMYMCVYKRICTYMYTSHLYNSVKIPSIFI